jgi:hypothetical protein
MVRPLENLTAQEIFDKFSKNLYLMDEYTRLFK